MVNHLPDFNISVSTIYIFRLVFIPLNGANAKIPPEEARKDYRLKILNRNERYECNDIDQTVMFVAAVAVFKSNPFLTVIAKERSN